MCSPHGRQKSEKMSSEEVRRVCGQVLPTATVLSPSVGGEPLLADIDLLVEQCRLYCVQLTMITNGVLLNTEKYKKMRNVLKVMHISYDSHIKETYEAIRVGADYEQVTDNIRDVCTAANKDGNEILLSVVVLKDNLRQLPEYVDFAADLGVDSIELQRLVYTVPNGAQIDAFGNIPDEEIAAVHKEVICRAEKRGLNLYSCIYGFVTLHVNRPAKAKKYDHYELFKALVGITPACMLMTYYIRINPDGQVLPCCYSEYPEVMGNVLEQSLEEIWNGKAYRRLRKQIFTRRFNKVCRNCEYRKRFNLDETRATFENFYRNLYSYQPHKHEP